MSTCESANLVQSMGQSAAQETIVPEIAQKDMKQSLMTQVPESTKSLKWLSEISQKVTETTPHHKGYSVLEMPIVHLSWNGETPQVTELTRRKIMPLAATTNLCNIFAGRISRFLSNWKALTCDPWVIQTVEKDTLSLLQQLQHNNTTILPPLINQRGISPQRGDTTAVTETGSARGSTQHQGFLLQHVHGSQEGRRSETGYQPETPEQICEIRAFQNGGTAHSQGRKTTGWQK